MPAGTAEQTRDLSLNGPAHFNDEIEVQQADLRGERWSERNVKAWRALRPKFASVLNTFPCEGLDHAPYIAADYRGCFQTSESETSWSRPRPGTETARARAGRSGWAGRARRSSVLARAHTERRAGRSLSGGPARGERVRRHRRHALPDRVGNAPEGLRRPVHPHADHGRRGQVIPTIVWTLPRPSESRYKGSSPLTSRRTSSSCSAIPSDPAPPSAASPSFGMRVDLNGDLSPDVVADARDLPSSSTSFDLVVLDPPLLRRGGGRDSTRRRAGAARLRG